MSKSPAKSCMLDPMSTFLVKDCIKILALSITKLLKLCLSEGMVLDSFKRAIVMPISKKQILSKD